MRLILSFSFIILVSLCFINAKLLIATSKDPIEMKKELQLLENEKAASKKDEVEKDEDSKKRHNVASAGNFSEQVAASVAPVSTGSIIVTDGIVQNYSSK
jgi:hypothetical protein